MYRECQCSKWCNSSLYYFPEKGREDSSSGLYGNRWQRWGQVHRGNGMRESDASHPDLMRLLRLMNNWTKDLAASTLNEILYCLYKSKRWSAFIPKCLRLHPNKQESPLESQDVLNLCLLSALQLNLPNAVTKGFFMNFMKTMLQGSIAFYGRALKLNLISDDFFTPQQLAT